MSTSRGRTLDVESENGRIVRRAGRMEIAIGPSAKSLVVGSATKVLGPTIF